MRALVGLVIVLGLLILVGTGVVVVTIVHRLGGPEQVASEIVVDEPAGTRIVAAAGYGGGLAVTLQGGGRPDRVVLLDSRGGRIGTVRLGR